MARCPYLDYESGGALFSQGDNVSASDRMEAAEHIVSEHEVKNKCKTDYGEEYEKCPVYKNR